MKEFTILMIAVISIPALGYRPSEYKLWIVFNFFIHELGMEVNERIYKKFFRKKTFFTVKKKKKLIS